MNNTPDINKLFEAARRQEADLRRQQQLKDMIDSLSAEETIKQGGETTPTNRRRLWPYISAAASIILLASVGLHILMNDNMSTSQPPLVAETKPKVPVVESLTTSNATTENGSHISVQNHRQTMTLAHNEIPNMRPSVDSQQVIPLADRTPFETPITLPDESLIAEEASTGSEIDENANTDSKPSGPVVYERTSTRLVCGSGCRPEVRRVTDAPQIALVNISGTGTTINSGTVSF